MDVERGQIPVDRGPVVLVAQFKAPAAQGGQGLARVGVARPVGCHRRLDALAPAGVNHAGGPHDVADGQPRCGERLPVGRGPRSIGAHAAPVQRGVAQPAPDAGAGIQGNAVLQPQFGAAFIPLRVLVGQAGVGPDDGRAVDGAHAHPVVGLALEAGFEPAVQQAEGDVVL